MKKQVLTIVSLVTFSLGGFVANAQVANGTLESWTNVSGGSVNYDEPDGDLLKTLNIISTFPENPPVTCFKTDTAHNGQFAARIVSKQLQSLNIFIPGVLGTVTPYFTPNIGADLTKPYVGRPATLKAWIRYTSVQGDSGQIFAYMLKDNGNNTYETLAVAKKTILFSITDWTEQTLTFNYSNTTDQSTDISLIFISSADYDFTNLTNCAGKVGSTMFVDDVELLGYNGISEMLFTGEELNVFPSPADNLVNVTVTENIENGVLSVTDMNGREVMSQTINGTQFTVDASTLKAGNYVVVLKQKNTILGRKTFVKK